jgi:hypothetical protein
VPLRVKVDETARLLAKLADLRLRERFAALRRAYPLPPATREVADKGFFGGLSGEPE